MSIGSVNQKNVLALERHRVRPNLIDSLVEA